MRIDIDYDTPTPDKTFNLTVMTVTTVNGKTQATASEVYRGLVIDPAQANDAAKAVNARSQLVKLSSESGSTGKRPAATGTASGYVDVSTLGLAAGDKIEVLAATKGGAAASLGTTAALPSAGLTDPVALAATLQSLVSAVLPNATVWLVGTGAKRYFVAEVDAADPSTIISFKDSGSGTAASKLGWSASAAPNVQHYCLGGDNAGAASGAHAGTDGTWDTAGDPDGIAAGLIGSEANKTGMYALLDTDLFNILCIPVTAKLGTKAPAVSTAAIKLCQDKRVMYLLVGPETSDTLGGIQTWLNDQSSLRSSNSALYFPGVQIPDPLDSFNLKRVAASGTVAGLYARTDANRGVWKAPAGTEASLSGVQQLPYKLTDPENGVLNPLAINCLRVFPVYGPVCWGARTLVGADQMADDYKYVPVRRLALFIEESLFRGTKWVVFEPNDEPLWAQVRLNVGAFMQILFRQGAFAGKTPQEAYFVKCDTTNNPQNTVNLGIINIGVGFAPLKPAEFVVIQIKQIAGDIAS